MNVWSMAISSSEIVVGGQKFVAAPIRFQWESAAIIPDLNVVSVQGDPDLCRVSSKKTVDAVRDKFEHHMSRSSRPEIAQIHTWTKTNMINRREFFSWILCIFGHVKPWQFRAAFQTCSSDVSDVWQVLPTPATQAVLIEVAKI